MITRLRTLLGLPGAILQARKIIRIFDPQVVVGVGGYASGPAMAAAILQRIPTLAFEPNYVPGFANRMVGRWVTAAAVHFEQTKDYFREAQVVGVPVREDFFHLPAAEADHAPTLLIFGGSQGAHSINQAMIGAITELRRRLPQLRVIHQTGERDCPEVQAAWARAGAAAEVSAFVDNMPQAFARADLLVCRSGASTVAEIAAVGKPAIFIPFPRAADDHQRRNAEAMVNAGAAVLIPEKELTPERLARAVAELLSDPARLREMSEKARRLSHHDSAGRLARIAVELAESANSGA
jgi:UDP-N-acetylglucosamine--N-acetylmuramyl-(pentapeptide) pyrophosphoryl-undecaprenol N-acetylglucosamine transferase